MASHLWTVHRPQPGVRRPVFRPTKVACHPGAGQERMRRGRIELSGDWPCLCDVTRAVGRCRAGGGSEAQQPLPGEALRSPLHPCVGRSQPWPLPQPDAAGAPRSQPGQKPGPSSPPTCGLRITPCSQTPGIPHGPRVLGNTGFGNQEGAGPLAPGEAQHAVLMVHMGPWPQRTRPAAWCCASGRGPCSQRAPPPPAWVPGV